MGRWIKADVLKRDKGVITIRDKDDNRVKKYKLGGIDILSNYAKRKYEIMGVISPEAYSLSVIPSKYSLLYDGKPMSKKFNIKDDVRPWELQNIRDKSSEVKVNCC